MKLHKGLAVYLVKDKMVAQELEALAEVEDIHFVALNDELIATEPESGAKLCEVLKKRGYYPRSIDSYNGKETPSS